MDHQSPLRLGHGDSRWTADNRGEYYIDGAASFCCLRRWHAKLCVVRSNCGYGNEHVNHKRASFQTPHLLRAGA